MLDTAWQQPDGSWLTPRQVRLLAQEWGDGRFSSSDGKRYRVGVDSPEARAVSRYFGRGRGVTFYVWTSDQHR